MELKSGLSHIGTTVDRCSVMGYKVFVHKPQEIQPDS